MGRLRPQEPGNREWLWLRANKTTTETGIEGWVFGAQQCCARTKPCLNKMNGPEAFAFGPFYFA